LKVPSEQSPQAGRTGHRACSRRDCSWQSAMRGCSTSSVDGRQMADAGRIAPKRDRVHGAAWCWPQSTTPPPLVAGQQHEGRRGGRGANLYQDVMEKMAHESCIANPGPMQRHQRSAQDQEDLVTFNDLQVYPAFIITYRVRPSSGEDTCRTVIS
jgi:hypothetical protein